MKHLYLAGLAFVVVLTACNKTKVQLTYSQNPAAYCVGAAVESNLPVTTASVSRFSVSPGLPAGLSLNQNDGSVSGTPMEVSPASDYEVTALGADGKVLAKHSLRIAVSGVVSFISPLVYRQDSTVSTIPTNSGAKFTGCVIHPSLPAGLVLDSATCAISGKPTEASPIMEYKVSANGACMSDSISVTISVLQTKPVTEVRASRVNRANRPARKASRFSR